MADPMHELDKTGPAPSGQCSKLVQAISRLADNRQPDGSSLVSGEDRSAIINGCHDLMIAYRQAAATTSADKMGLEAALRSAYEKVAAWPENRMRANAVEELGEGFTDLLKLRNLVPDVLAYLSSTSAGVTEEQTGTFADGVKAAARFVRQRLDDYVSEHGMYDPETGATEFPGNGDETVCEWEEIIEGLEALKEIKP